MPAGRPKQNQNSAPFDPRNNQSEAPKAPSPAPAAPQPPAQVKPADPAPAPKTPEVSPAQELPKEQQGAPVAPSEVSQLLTLVASIQETVRNQSLLIAQLQNDRSKMSSDIEQYRMESAGQRSQSMEQARANRISKAERMKRLWAAQPKRNFYVPYQPGEKKGARFWVQANGYAYVHSDGQIGIPKGTYCEVPVGVANIAMESLNQVIENMGFDSRLETRDTTSDGQPFDPERLQR